MPLPMKPTRSNPLDMAPAAIDEELRAQLDARADRRRATARAKRPKATYDLAPAVQQIVANMAEQEDVSQSDIVALAIVRLRADLGAGLDLTPIKRPARSLKALYRLELAETSK